jgi:prolyl-tRNA synthetase
VTLVRRDSGEKRTVPLETLIASIQNLFEEIQSNMLKRAQQFRDEHTYTVNSFDEFREVLQEKRGFLLAHWCGSAYCENDIKAETEATIRTIPFGAVIEDGKCVYCGKPSTHRVLFAKAY